MRFDFGVVNCATQCQGDSTNFSDNESKPTTVRLNQGNNELLLGMHIIKQLGLAVNFTMDAFQTGQTEWKWRLWTMKIAGYVLFSRHPVLARDWGLFREMGNLTGDVLMVRRYRKWPRSNKYLNQNLIWRKSELGRYDLSFADVKETIVNFRPSANMVSGKAFSGAGSQRMGILDKLREIRKFHVKEGNLSQTKEQINE